MRYSYRYACYLACLLLALLSADRPWAASAASQGQLAHEIYVPLVTQALAVSARVLFEQRVIDLTNAFRRQNGCQVALVRSPQLSASAEAHSQDMALNDRLSHNGSDGSTMASRITATGYKYSQIAENVAAGQSTPEEVVAGWTSSAAHRANVLNCELRDVGIGFYDQPDDQANVLHDNGQVGGPYRFYWTQDFGTR
jgi:uncharacterized protein YkwD